MLAKKKILCYTIGIERKRENIMKKTNQKTEYVEEEIVGIVALKDLGL